MPHILQSPAGNEYAVSNETERVRLQSRGYRLKSTEPNEQTEATASPPAERPRSTRRSSPPPIGDAVTEPAGP